MTTDRLGHAAGLADHDLAWNAMGLGHVASLTNLTASRVRHLTVTDLLGHGAGGVRHLLGPLLTGVAARRVRHLTADRLAGPGAGGVRHLLGPALTSIRTGRIRHLLGAGLTGPAAGCIRHLLREAVRNPATGGVRHLAVLRLADPPGAADLTSHSLGNPNLLAAHARWALDLFGVAAAGLVDAAASAFIPGERTRSADAAVNHWPWNAFLHDLPFTAFDVLTPGFGDRTASRVADILVASLGFGAVASAADVAVASLVVRLANLIANGAVARLVARLAHGVADVAVASLVVRLPNLAADGAVARLIARLANGVTDVAIAGLVARLADGVTLVTVASLVNGPVALDGHLLDASVHDRLTLLIRLCTPSGLVDRLVAPAVAGACLAVVLRRLAAFSWTASVTAHSAEESGF